MKNRTLLCNAAIVLLVAVSTLTQSATGADHQSVQSRPIQLGTSGGNIFDRSTLYCCSGTLGALVQDENGQYILSNNHVLARVNQGQAGEPVNQPGQIDQNCSQDGTVANLTRFVKIGFGKGRNVPLNEVDAAIAAIVPGLVQTDGAILGIGTVSAETVAASVGQSVQKSGRTTGHTTGTVSATDVTVDIAYSADCGGASNQKARFVNQIIIGPGSFSTGGDSGSVIFESGATPRAVGLLFAGNSSSTIANPIDSVLSQLNVSMVGGSTPGATYGTIAGIVTDSGGVAIAGATVTVDSGASAITGQTGNYSIGDVPTGSRTVTASATGYSSKNISVTVNNDETTTANFALDAASAGGQVFVQCVTYSGQGGKNQDKDLLITITVVDGSGAPVAGAQVDISVTLNSVAIGNGTGAISSSSGQVTYVIRNAANGTYSSTVTSATKLGLDFEGSTPANSFVKGITPAPASFCRDGAAAAISPAGNGNAKAAVDHARNVKARHGNAWMEIEDVIGHGIGRNENGEPVIDVYLSKENGSTRARIPTRVDNVPVRVIITGPFTAY